MNTVQTDIGAALTASTAADGQTPITGNWNWGGYSISNLATMTTTGAATVGTMLTVGNGATVTKGGLTVTAGGLTVSAGGMAVIGNSAISGTLGIADAVLVSKGGVTVTAGGVIVAADGATITGNSTVTGTLTVTSTATAANGTTGTQLVNYSQFPPRWPPWHRHAAQRLDPEMGQRHLYRRQRNASYAAHSLPPRLRLLSRSPRRARRIVPIRRGRIAALTPQPDSRFTAAPDSRAVLLGGRLVINNASISHNRPWFWAPIGRPWHG